MKRIQNWAPSFALLAALSVAPLFAAPEKTVAMNSLPPAVRKTIEAQVASTGAKVHKTTVETESGVTTYECESVLANGKHQDFEISPDGKLGEVEDTAELTSVPAPVKASIDKATAGGGTIKELVTITRDGKLTGYGVTVAKAGKWKETVLNVDGTEKK